MTKQYTQTNVRVYVELGMGLNTSERRLKSDPEVFWNSRLNDQMKINCEQCGLWKEKTHEKWQNMSPTSFRRFGDRNGFESCV